MTQPPSRIPSIRFPTQPVPAVGNVVVQKRPVCRLCRGLSGSGPIAFGVAADNPSGLRGLVAIATSAGSAEGLSYPAGFPILMISGTQDPSFPIEDAREEYQSLKEQGIEADMVEINDDHYLFLSSPEELRRVLEKFRRLTPYSSSDQFLK